MLSRRGVLRAQWAKRLAFGNSFGHTSSFLIYIGPLFAYSHNTTTQTTQAKAYSLLTGNILDFTLTGSLITFGSAALGPPFPVSGSLPSPYPGWATSSSPTQPAPAGAAASVPGPLPVLGVAAAAFGFSRKLRKRTKRSTNSAAGTLGA
jgi:hypothetical protein